MGTQTYSFALLPIKVEAKKYDKRPMVLHREIGTGKVGDQEISIIQNEVTAEFYFKIGEAIYMVGPYEILEAIIKAEDIK